MTDIPREVLSEHFQARMRGRRLVSAVFTTYRFEPGFFEQEVLPVFLDLALSHASAIRLVQLEDAMRQLKGSVAVYFDENGIVSDGGPARLDIRRIAVPHRTGIFHPKNVFALVEAVEPDEHGHHARALLVACMSANLTRSGWWENVEGVHVEEIAEDDHHRLRDDLDAFIKSLVDRVRGKAADSHQALRDVRAFLKGTSQRAHRSTEGRLHTHFHSGRASVPDFLDEVAGASLRGLCLEVISPYFDGADDSAPLGALIARFQPREVRVFLPRGAAGEALCRPAFYEWVREHPDVSWGALPSVLRQLGKGDDARARVVHAKVYRFFDPTRGGRELLYVGSANLTRQGHRIDGSGGNWENGFLVEVTAKGVRPAFWMTTDARRPAEFDGDKRETEGTAASGGTRLSVRFWWDGARGEVWWEGREPSPELIVEHRGTHVFTRTALEPNAWVPLTPEESQRLADVLRSTSLLQVRGEGDEPGVLLVQEEGMAQRPSLLFELTPAEILRYWSQLTPEQRTAFLEAKARVEGDDDPLIARVAPLEEHDTLFGRFAGIFHAFECAERAVTKALQEGTLRDAEYRLFGQKYDSLGTLLDRVLDDVRARRGDAIDQYVLLLCARQLMKHLGRRYPDFFDVHRDATARLGAQLDEIEVLRSALGSAQDGMPEFLRWFEAWFVRRAEPLAGPGAL